MMSMAQILICTYVYILHERDHFFEKSHYQKKMVKNQGLVPFCLIFSIAQHHFCMWRWNYFHLH